MASRRPGARSAGSPERPTRHLAYGHASGLGRILAAHRTGRSEAVHLETVFTSPLAATLLTMARDGQGVAWLPRTLAEDDLSRGRLVRAGHDGFDIPIEIRLFRSPESSNRAAEQLWITLPSS